MTARTSGRWVHCLHQRRMKLYFFVVALSVIVIALNTRMGLGLQLFLAKHSKSPSWTLCTYNRLLKRIDITAPHRYTFILQEKMALAMDIVLSCKEDVDRVLQEHPDKMEALLLRGRIHYQMRDYALAEKDFAAALAAYDSSEWPIFHIRRGRIERSIERSRMAIEVESRLLQGAKENEENGRGRAGTGDY